jgi:hypothetical protein
MILAGLSFERKSLVENTVAELLQMADEFDAMAARATTDAARQALHRLAARFRIFASSRANSQLGQGSVAPGVLTPSRRARGQLALYPPII